MEQQKKITQNELTTMELHQVSTQQGFIVRRVMGGWIYEMPSSDGNNWSAVFVPFTAHLIM